MPIVGIRATVNTPGNLLTRGNASMSITMDTISTNRHSTTFPSEKESENIMNYFMPINLTTIIKWINSYKVQNKPKLTQEEIGLVNCLVSIKEIEILVKNPSTNKNPISSGNDIEFQLQKEEVIKFYTKL